MTERSDSSPAPSAFRSVPRTGVIFVTEQATRLGFSPEDPAWCNLGQGQPETAALSGAPPRVTSVAIDGGDLDYAPVAGLWELREAIAALYNRLYRRGMASQYSAENVAVAGGGRTSLTRAAASLGRINLGHFLPDYTAYEELLEVFRDFQSIPILLDPERGYAFSRDDLRREITGRGLGALLFSNPCNPTGRVIGGDELRDWVDTARALDCTLLVDEFYSHFVWRPELAAPCGMVSAAQFVEDVDADPVVLIDGLTKNWRYPGWRVTWAIGPKAVIRRMTSAGSFLDGGAARPMQRAAIPLLDADTTRAETAAIAQAFAPKRDALVRGLRQLGFTIDVEPEGTFYVWASAERLPPALATGEQFFRAALQHKVITVPGQFFGVDPGRRRGARPSRFRHHLRFSFGPSMAVLETALSRIGALIADAGRGPVGS
ncbi:MAG: pyridoxal phosphate-dependent aminotransferase [Planctomycetes bacterium]|nr:pyridoxal phosphate-dependent aminotransferase [Planctomycetota bacterium]